MSGKFKCDADKLFIMPFTNEDKAIIQHYCLDKGYRLRKLLNEFPDKGWTEGGLKKLLKKINETGSCERLPGSGRPVTASTEENIEAVEALIESQEENGQGTHLSQNEIAEKLGIAQSSV